MLRTAAHTLPGAVGLLQPRGGYQKDGAQSAVIKNCLQYISTHLHEELRLEELAHECGLRSRSSTATTHQKTDTDSHISYLIAGRNRY